jgi:hypothetical protein
MRRFISILFSALLLGSAWAQSPAPATANRPPPAPVSKPPQPQTVGGITWMDGGIGDGEVALIREQQAGYSALIEMVEVEPGSQRGNWTADVAVEIKSGGQTLANLPVQGPLLLLRMSPGKYTLEATHADVKLTKTIEIKAKAPLLRERFVWKAAAGSLGTDLKN